MEFILETLGKIGFDWRMGLFNLINFLIIYWVLKRYAFGPIMKVINERQEKMKEGMDNYKKSQSELQMAEQKAQGIIDEAKVAANKVVEQSHDDSKQVAEDMKNKAKTEIESLIAQAKKNIDIDKQDMKDTLRKETVELVVLAVEKVLGERMDGKKDETYIQEILGSLKA
ncbi:MAG: F0F1 ATP synthase subunit B [Candidatus Magasanikbacteria bacterium]|jgi:F-type H+-transporting ATPase subunit b|nr:F0F1 ATP synthase subunit B [Candidatus Magasanikbacteria bacterium]